MTKGRTGKNILITTSSFGEEALSMLDKIKGVGFNIVMNPYKKTLKEPEIASLIKEFDPQGIIAGTEPLNKSVLGGASSLKVISRCGVDMENVDRREADRRKIKVFNTPSTPAQAVAELTVGLILNVIRRVSEADRNIRAGKWDKLMGRLLGDATVGIVGCGNIGNRVAEYLSVFSCRIIGYDPRAKGNRHIKMTTLDSLAKEADIITFHIPLTEENVGMVNRKFINSLKTGVFIINTSRGGIIDEEALLNGLNSGHVGGAALDTFGNEPYSGPLINIKNVILTAHMGSYAKEARARMESESVNNLLRGLAEVNDLGT